MSYIYIYIYTHIYKYILFKEKTINIFIKDYFIETVKDSVVEPNGTLKRDVLK